MKENILTAVDNLTTQTINSAQNLLVSSCESFKMEIKIYTRSSQVDILIWSSN